MGAKDVIVLVWKKFCPNETGYLPALSQTFGLRVVYSGGVVYTRKSLLSNWGSLWSKWNAYAQHSCSTDYVWDMTNSSWLETPVARVEKHVSWTGAHLNFNNNLLYLMRAFWHGFYVIIHVFGQTLGEQCFGFTLQRWKIHLASQLQQQIAYLMLVFWY